MHHYEPGPEGTWRRDPATRAVLVVEASGTVAAPLRRVSPDFSDLVILSSPNALTALDRVDSHAIDAVAVDVDAPGVHGNLLLQVLAKLYPTVIRIALADPESAAGHTASRLAHQVIDKPVDAVALSLTLAASLEETGVAPTGRARVLTRRR